MNVFVLCTGRCGSTTFAKACEHVTNFSSAHESRARYLGADRLLYPENHIEVDNRLSWFLGRLNARYGDYARYVHLTRDKEATALSSYLRLDWRGSIASAYRESIAMSPDAEGIVACRDYVETVTANIDMFLADKTHVMQFRMENAEQDFPRFWDWIGAKGDFDSAMAEWSLRHNATEKVERGSLDTLSESEVLVASH